MLEQFLINELRVTFGLEESQITEFKTNWFKFYQEGIDYIYAHNNATYNTEQSIAYWQWSTGRVTNYTYLNDNNETFLHYDETMVGFPEISYFKDKLFMPSLLDTNGERTTAYDHF